MVQTGPSPELPACYAMVQPGLEKVASEEIMATLKGKTKRLGPGYVVFRLSEIHRNLLRLRTTEDVFLLAWGTDQLTYRAQDLENIRKWTQREANWSQLLKIHHSIRPKPKGKPTYRLVVQMHGEHGYRRVDARKALSQGLAGKLPASWRHAEENASVEIWLTIHGAHAVCGLRLSDRSMRHRTYKEAHIPASLRPTVAAAMVRLADLRPGQVIIDPLCGAGTILTEILTSNKANQWKWQGSVEETKIIAGDINPTAVRAAQANLIAFGNEDVEIQTWDARKLPFPEPWVDRIVSNLPFGVQLGHPAEMGPLYRSLVKEFDRVLKKKGIAVLLVADAEALQEPAQKAGWQQKKLLRVRVLGQPATILVFEK